MSWIYDSTAGNPALDGARAGFSRFSREEYSKLSRQHNILVFVGNGFDLQVLGDYEHTPDSRYETFYHYLKMTGFNSQNIILDTMERLRNQVPKPQNWSDIEAAISTAIGIHPPEAILASVRDIQAAFAQFLQLVTPATLLEQLGHDAAAEHWSHTSLSEFLYDISNEADFLSMEFPRKIWHYDLFNFRFINFNYTTLLDDYVHLDHLQFNPLRHKNVDTNFMFKNDPRAYLTGGEIDLGYSTYVLTEVAHPHGILSTPRSLLFGIDAEDDYKKKRAKDHPLKKAYWSQAHALYRPHFTQADLFIIFGCSLGVSDGWWWRGILRALRQTRTQTVAHPKPDSFSETPELIIYWWNGGSRLSVEQVKEKFLTVGGGNINDPADLRLKDRIHVVLYDNETRPIFLNTKKS